MSVLEIEEFSSFDNIVKFLTSVNMPKFISKYFENEPKYTAMIGEIGGTVLTFSDAPLEIGVKAEAELSVFVDFRIEAPNELVILKFINKDSVKQDILDRLGPPDFEIDEEKRIKLNHTAQVIKYFIDSKFSISFDHNEKVEMVRIFYDNYR